MRIQAEYPVKITNPDKLLWPDVGMTKAAYMQYLVDVAPVLLTHLRNRPVTVIRYPHGVGGQSFYQKNAPKGTPEWVTTTPIWSEDKNAFIHCVVVDKIATLLWLANQACLEFHVGFTTIVQPIEPDWATFDLDPTVPGFGRVRRVALALHDILNELQLPHVAKTSGATGLQLFIPLLKGHTFAQTRVITKAIAEYLQLQLPNDVTLARLKKDRADKVYVDYPQHGEHRTLICAYSARARQEGTVSTPVRWDELRSGAEPSDFTMKNVPQRIQALGDLMNCGRPASLHHIASFFIGNRANHLR